MNPHPFTSRVIEIIRSIPEGTVCSYGIIAAMAGNHRAARQVSRILHSCSQKEGLPWHRVINKQGRISLKPFQGYETQKRLLEQEGVVFDKVGQIDLETYLWRPDKDTA